MPVLELPPPPRPSFLRRLLALSVQAKLELLAALFMMGVYSTIIYAAVTGHYSPVGTVLALVMVGLMLFFNWWDCLRPGRPGKPGRRY